MAVFVGLDPGGVSKFGWAVAADAPCLPLLVVATGVSGEARSAVTDALAHVPAGEVVAGAAIDAPLVWSRSGPRASDRLVRDAIRRAGAPNPQGTVQSPNSLKGACLVQGILAALELRARLPDLRISESHPKALIWLCSEAKAVTAPSEDERDAVLSAFTAWAMCSKRPDWRDLYAEEIEPLWLVPAPIHYFMPVGRAQYAG